uniref:Putative methyltransferase n=1 Tax=viral metagenome TaxID=1070528 RepID=A0A6M3XMG1_9ZZZZ
MVVEQIGECTLYLGDCLEILPTLGKVDAVVTDPPYGIGFKYENDGDDPEAYADLIRGVVGGVSRLVEDGPCLFWQGMLNADKWHKWFPPGFRLFAACKGFVQYRPTPIQYSWDPIVWWGNARNKPSVYAKDFHMQSLAPFGAGRERILHPCPRPLEQVVYIVGIFTEKRDTILDPFMGSGTTGVACVQLDRKFIGIEIEPKYFDIACKRIETAVARPKGFKLNKIKKDKPKGFGL